jgi:hypothetical protein
MTSRKWFRAASVAIGTRRAKSIHEIRRRCSRKTGNQRTKQKVKLFKANVTAMPNAVKRTKRDESLDDVVVIQIWMFNKDGALGVV